MIVSEKQRLANYLNSLKARGKSTGPSNFVNTKYNAVKHGMTASEAVLPGENVEDYKRLCEETRKLLSPRNEIDTAKAEQIALCLWKLRRGAVAEENIFRMYTTLDGIDWQGLLSSGYLKRICRYEKRIMGNLNTLLKEFIRIQNANDLSK